VLPIFLSTGDKFLFNMANNVVIDREYLIAIGWNKIKKIE